MIGVHDEAVEMAAPSVPPDDERADHARAVDARDDQRVTITREQRPRLVVLTQAAGRPTELAPELDDLVDVAQDRVANLDQGRQIVPSAASVTTSLRPAWRSSWRRTSAGPRSRGRRGCRPHAPASR